MSTRFVILDTETTGLSPSEGDRLVEIGCLELQGRRLSTQQFHRYLNPERPCPEQATAIHGLTDDFLAQQVTFATIADEFCAFIQDAHLLIHNANFDLGFLNAELARIGKGAVLDYARECTDTLVLAREMFPGKRNSLDALCQRFEIDLSNRQFHGALKDAQLLAQVYLALTAGQQDMEMAFQTASDAAPLTVPTNLPLISVNAIERAGHQEILQKIARKTAPLWPIDEVTETSVPPEKINAAINTANTESILPPDNQQPALL